VKLTKRQSLLAAGAMLGVVLLYLIFLAAPMQQAFGMLGLLLTELGLLALAVGGALLCKDDLRQVFPLARPRLRPAFGSVLLWLGSYPLVLLSALVAAVLVPETFDALTGSMSDMLSSVPPLVQFLIVAVSPAICEEAVFRGFIRHHVSPLGGAAVQVAVVGVLFGIFHLDPIRFAPTAVLGAAITYAAVKTHNLLYPFLIHLCNNSLSVLSSLFVQSADTTAASQSLTIGVLGAYLFLCAFCPWLLWAASSLLGPRGERPNALRRVLACMILSAACVVSGIVLMMFDPMLLQAAL